MYVYIFLVALAENAWHVATNPLCECAKGLTLTLETAYPISNSQHWFNAEKRGQHDQNLQPSTSLVA